MKKFITFFNSKVHINTLIFPPVDCDHHAMTALFEYRGSLAWYCVNENKDANPYFAFFFNFSKDLGQS